MNCDDFNVSDFEEENPKCSDDDVKKFLDLLNRQRLLKEEQEESAKNDKLNCFQFGKYKGQRYEHVANIDPHYCEWLIHQPNTRRYTVNKLKSVLGK